MPQQLLGGMSSRKRRPNWTDQECLLLAQLMHERKGIIKAKCNAGVSIQDKRQAWEEIAQAINAAFPHMQRTVSDCNKKWENLLAKSREEIRRQKKQSGTEDVSLTELSTVTRVVVSIMNLSNMLQPDREDSSVSEMMQTQHNSSDENGNGHMMESHFMNSDSHTDLQIPAYEEASISPPEEKVLIFPDVSNSVASQFGTPRAAGFTVSAEHSDPRSTPAAHCTTVQERMDLELSVLRRQEAVLKLQEEYYTLKIKLMKQKMEKQVSKD